MKLTKLISAAILFSMISLSIFSCKKESTSPKTTQEKIAGRWKLQSSVRNNFYAGMAHITTYTGTAADYADFRSDNKVYSYVDGSYDTSAYGIISDTKIWIEYTTAVFDIQTLTDTQLKLYMKLIYNAAEYDESTLDFSR